VASVETRGERGHGLGLMPTFWFQGERCHPVGIEENSAKTERPTLHAKLGGGGGGGGGGAALTNRWKG